MSKVWQGPLEKIDDYRWRIPRSYKPGMRVPGIIYADEKLLEDIRQDKAPEQVANVACLPGIVNYSLAMPDIHWGYGPPIGAVFAMDPETGGVITPGGVGYDINCLSGETLILHRFGYTLPIKEFEDKWYRNEIQCLNFTEDTLEQANIKLFLKLKSKKRVYRLRTSTGKEIVVTEDHPFYTPDGMKELKRLKLGSQVAVNPFQGVKFESPSDKVIVSLIGIEKTLLRLRKDPQSQSGQIIVRKLKERDLIPLTYEHPKLPYLIKIMGMIFGDGSMNFIGKRGDGIIGFFAKKDDLEKIKQDLKELGYNSSQIYSRKTKLIYKGKVKNFKNYLVYLNASSLLVLLAALGVPVGRKVSQKYNLPDWLKCAPLWQKRLFLASLFGAELSTPRSKISKKGNFYAPVLYMSKREEHLKNGISFLQNIADLVKEFGVETTDLVTRKKYYTRKKEISWHLELIFSCKPRCLINLWGKIGFVYNRKKSLIANLAIHYLYLKQAVIDKRLNEIETILALKAAGLSHKQVFKQIGGEFVGERYVQSVAQRGDNIIKPRIPQNFPPYPKFVKEATAGLSNPNMVWDRIENLEEIERPDFVYDFTVAHKDHNFIANNFVVSNCGVRLVRTNFSSQDIKGKLQDLVTALFQYVPAGVGSKGQIRVSQREERQILVKGARWAVERGYGTEEDLLHTEEKGEMAGADPDTISDRAFERGKAQSGTLGSGNHFIEVQVVDEIYDNEAAQRFNLFKGGISLMIHSGSRGFGYQVCDDYIKRLMPALNKYNIKILDRQLVCAPVNSAEGKTYLAAMRCAANYAWANRQCLMYLARGAFEKVFNKSFSAMGMSLIYDVAHNIAKIETYKVNGKDKKLCVHRKGATRAFGPGHPALPDDYKDLGQPVIIPGDMGRNSYLLLGTQKAMDETFGSCCHGAGRLKSRHEAIRQYNPSELVRELRNKGIIVMASSRRTITEEAPGAYKDVNDVVDVVHKAGIAKKVCRMRPLGVIKG